MDRSSRPAAPKDDDSWGKLASDLFGIDLGPQDDFDFADAEPTPPPVVTPQTTVTETPVSEAVTPQEELAADSEADDAEPEAVGEPAGSDDYWGALETWDWTEGEVAREKRSESRDSGDRPPRRDDGGRRGQRPPRRGRDEGPRRERPPRGESRRTEEPAASSEPREASEPRSEERRSRPAREEAPRRREERPRREASSSASSADRPRPPKRPKPSVSDDDFGAGLDEEFITEQDEWEAGPFEEAAAPAAAQDDDDFGAGFDEPGTEKTARRSADDEQDEGDRPKRRRRRRRRRPAGERAESSGSEDKDRDPADDEAGEAQSGDEEFVEDDRPAESEEEDEDRPRPRRRRRRRRPSSSESAPRARTESDEDRDDEDPAPRRPQPTVEPRGSHLEEVFDGDEPEPIQRINYDDVPTWDEAISYLVRVKEGDSRGRGGRDQNGGGRGRRPPSRRPRSDASPDA